MGAAPDLRPSALRDTPAPSSRHVPLPVPARRKPRNPLRSPLPSLRILLHPSPGLGVDMRVPLSRRTRCYMQLDSFFNAPSMIRIGVHPRNQPGIRLQLSPVPRLSVRLPMRIGGAKYLQIGCWCGMGGVVDDRNESIAEWKWGQGKGVWAGLTVEIWRYTTGAGMVDERVRSRIREALSEKERSVRKSRLDDFPVDPRERDDVLKIMRQVLSEQRKVREQRTGIPSGSVVGKDGRL